MKSSISAALILILAAGSLGILGDQVRAQQLGPGTIAVAVVPPQLPADGKTYESLVIQILNSKGLPVIPASPVKISLTSSKTSVGNVDPTVTLNAGEFYASAKFYSTKTPGSTNITAIAEGYGAAQFKVTTVIAGGTPFKLAVYSGPETLLPDRGVTSTVVVQLQDLRGVPAIAPGDVPVTLTSSRTSIGSVVPSAVIPKGGTFATAAFSATDAAGSTTITASASGYAAGSALIFSKGPTPIKLVVFAAPPVIRALSGEQSWIAVQVQDLDGRPAKAASDIQVSLSSSNSTVGSVNGTTVIRTGSSHAMATFAAGGAVGSTEITASASGLLSGSASVRAASQGAVPTMVRIFLAPDRLLPDNGQYQSVVVQLQNSSGFPASSSFAQSVILSSSNSEVGKVPGIINIPAGTTFVIAPFEATFLAGTTEITAHAPNLEKDVATMSSSGPVPSRLAVYSVPRVLTADGVTYKAIVIQLQDVSGSPAKAPQDIGVSLSSSKTEIGAVDTSVIIPSGATYVLADFHSTATAGRTDITAIASGYESSSYPLTTVEPYPSKLTVYSNPPALIANGKSYDSIFVQLQDSSGNPATLATPLSISLSSSSSAMGKVEGESVIQAGSTFTVVPLQISATAAEFTIFAFASGFSTGSAVVKTITIPVSLSVNPSGTLSVKKGERLELTVQASSEGLPVQGAKVSTSSTLGSISPSLVTTDENGFAKISFLAQSSGSGLLALGVTASGYEPASVVIPVTIEEAGILAIFNILGTIQGIPILLILLIGLGAVTGFLLIKRRKVPTETEELEYPAETS